MQLIHYPYTILLPRKNSALDFTGFFCTIQNFLVTAASILDTESLAI